MKKSSLLTLGVALLAGVIAFVAIRSFLEPKAPPAAEQTHSSILNARQTISIL